MNVPCDSVDGIYCCPTNNMGREIHHPAKIKLWRSVEGALVWSVKERSTTIKWVGFSIVAADASAEYAYLSPEGATGHHRACKTVKVVSPGWRVHTVVYIRRCRPLFINIWCSVGTQLDVAGAARRPVATPDMGWVERHECYDRPAMTFAVSSPPSTAYQERSSVERHRFESRNRPATFYQRHLPCTVWVRALILSFSPSHRSLARGDHTQV